MNKRAGPTTKPDSPPVPVATEERIVLPPGCIMLLRDYHFHFKTGQGELQAVLDSPNTDDNKASTWRGTTKSAKVTVSKE